MFKLDFGLGDEAKTRYKGIEMCTLCINASISTSKALASKQIDALSGCFTIHRTTERSLASGTYGS